MEYWPSWLVDDFSTGILHTYPSSVYAPTNQNMARICRKSTCHPNIQSINNSSTFTDSTDSNADVCTITEGAVHDLVASSLRGLNVCMMPAAQCPPCLRDTCSVSSPSLKIRLILTTSRQHHLASPCTLRLWIHCGSVFDIFTSDDG